MIFVLVTMVTTCLQAKRKLKAERLQSELISGTLAKTGSDDNSEEDEDKYADEIDMPGTKFDSKRCVVEYCIISSGAPLNFKTSILQ